MPLFLERSKVTAAAQQWRGKGVVGFLFAACPGAQEGKVRQRACGRKYHIFNRDLVFLASFDEFQGIT